MPLVPHKNAICLCPTAQGIFQLSVPLVYSHASLISSLPLLQPVHNLTLWTNSTVGLSAELWHQPPWPCRQKCFASHIALSRQVPPYPLSFLVYIPSLLHSFKGGKSTVMSKCWCNKSCNFPTSWRDLSENNRNKWEVNWRFSMNFIYKYLKK